MLVEQLFLDNPLANFNYLIACPETGEALALDPLDSDRVLRVAKDRGWEILQVVNTHEHWDHTGGNAAVKEATGATVMSHVRAASSIGGVDRTLVAGDVIKVGNTVELLVMDTPGHTFAHVCLRARGDHDALFSGDTLFNAGAGNCTGGGDPLMLYQTFRDQLAILPDETRIYPGHSYAAKNLAFTLDREPGNAYARELKAQVEAMAERGEHLQSTMAMERRVNVFLRLESDDVGEALRDRFPGRELGSARDRFVALRELRNKF